MRRRYPYPILFLTRTRIIPWGKSGSYFFKTQFMNVSRTIILALIGLIVVGFVSSHAATPARPDRFFDVVSFDTMKLSRDSARNEKVTANIPTMVEQLAKLHPTHVAIGTPYNEEFIPVMKKWTGAIHSRGMNVWFRGNFSQWEDWFDYGRMKNPSDHIELTYQFITSHPELFRDGDIFTPVPEPENGGFGDPRFSLKSKTEFFDFLPKSYKRCQEAFAKIRKNVTCGYYSVNGDVAKLFTRQDVQKIGNVLAIDHYVKTPKQLVDDARTLHEKTGADIILGEYGAPIPDIHGNLNQDEQAALIEQNLDALTKARSFIRGINYWTTFGGSTRLFEAIDQPKKAAAVVEKYYYPITISGTVVDAFGLPIKSATLEVKPYSTTTTDAFGKYTILTTQDHLTLRVNKLGYKSQTHQATVENHTAALSMRLEPNHPGLLYTLRLLMARFLDYFH